MLQERKSGRISAAVSAPVYRKLEKAAEIRGTTISRFLVQAAVEKAELVIEQDMMIRLTEQDAEVFFEAVENPPLPNEKLLNAVKGYQEFFPNAENRDTEQTS